MTLIKINSLLEVKACILIKVGHKKINFNSFVIQKNLEIIF